MIRTDGNRKRRIRVVVVAGIGLFALFAAFFVTPVLAVALWPGPERLGESDALLQAVQISNAANVASRISLIVAGGCFVYLSAVLATWFIGPQEVSHREEIQ